MHDHRWVRDILNKMRKKMKPRNKFKSVEAELIAEPDWPPVEETCPVAKLEKEDKASE